MSSLAQALSSPFPKLVPSLTALSCSCSSPKEREKELFQNIQRCSSCRAGESVFTADFGSQNFFLRFWLLSLLGFLSFAFCLTFSHSLSSSCVSLTSQSFFPSFQSYLCMPLKTSVSWTFQHSSFIKCPIDIKI